jgi:hypothetical protein
VNINLFRGEHMPPLDMISSDIDGFVVAKFAGLRCQSKVVTSKNPVWN